MNQWAPKQKGFTIVELLIVIVVIAILAAITIVAYNGIQTRARNTQVTAGVNVYYKAITEYYAVYSIYPGSTNLRACLGSGYPSDQCWNGVSGTVATNATIDANLSEFISQRPTLATSLFSIGLGNNIRAGALYDYNNRKIVYYLQGAGQNCGLSGSSGFTEGGIVTQCSLPLPN